MIVRATITVEMDVQSSSATPQHMAEAWLHEQLDSAIQVLDPNTGDVLGEIVINSDAERRVTVEPFCALCGSTEKENVQHRAVCPDDCGAHDFRSER